MSIFADLSHVLAAVARVAALVEDGCTVVVYFSGHGSNGLPIPSDGTGGWSQDASACKRAHVP
jgi:hypothetical protein